MNQTSWQIRPLHPTDAPALSALSTAIGWGQGVDTAAAIIRRNAGHIFGAFDRTGLIGSAAAFVYAGERLAFINQVTVHPARRRRGIATALLHALMQPLRDCSTLRLYATAVGRGVYEKVGFTAYGQISRCVGEACADAPPSRPGLAPMCPNDLTAVCDFDARNFGCRRDELLHDLYRSAPQCAWSLRRNGRLVGFVLGRNAHAGTLQCSDPAAVETLLACALFRPEGGRVTVDLFRPLPLPEGFTELMPMTAMQYGQPRPAPDSAYCCSLGADVG